MYVDPSIVDGHVRGLRPFYYVLNNLFCQTIKPKIGSTSNLYGYARNLLQGSNLMENPSQFLDSFGMNYRLQLRIPARFFPMHLMSCSSLSG